MLKTYVAPAFAAFMALLLVGAAVPAEAKRNGGGGWGGGGHSGGSMRSYSGGGHSGPRVNNYRAAKIYRNVGPSSYAYKYNGYKHHGKRHHRYLNAGIPLAYYGAYSYVDSCYWLRRRAVITGNPYWWDRYYDCMNGGYYD